MATQTQLPNHSMLSIEALRGHLRMPLPWKEPGPQGAVDTCDLRLAVTEWMGALLLHQQFTDP